LRKKREEKKLDENKEKILFSEILEMQNISDLDVGVYVL